MCIFKKSLMELSVLRTEDCVGEYEQGFLTNKNRFVGREEGAIKDSGYPNSYVFPVPLKGF